MRRAVVIVLAVIALAPAGVRAQAWYRNGRDGLLRAACCCPAQAGHHRPSVPDNQVRSACCCTIIELAAREAPARSTPPVVSGVSPPAAVAVTPVPPALVGAAALCGLPATRGPPELSEPLDLFVRHCALLL